MKAEVSDTSLVSSQQGKRGAVVTGIQTQGAAIGATGVEGLDGAEGYAGDDSTLALFFGYRRKERSWTEGRTTDTNQANQRRTQSPVP